MHSREIYFRNSGAKIFFKPCVVDLYSYILYTLNFIHIPFADIVQCENWSVGCLACSIIYQVLVNSKIYVLTHTSCNKTVSINFVFAQYSAGMVNILLIERIKKKKPYWVSCVTEHFFFYKFKQLRYKQNI